MVMNQKRNILIEQVNLHYLRLIQLESELDIRPRVLKSADVPLNWISKCLLKTPSFPKQSLFVK